MPLEIGEVGESFVDRVSDLPLVRGPLRSPPFTALLLTALVAVVLMATYAPAVRAGGARCALRAALYFFLGALFVLFAHHSLLTRSARAEAANRSAREVHAGVARAQAWPRPEPSPSGPGERPSPAGAAGEPAAPEPARPAGPAGEPAGPGPRGRPDNVAPFALEAELPA